VRWTASGPDMGGYVGAQTSDVEVFLQERPAEQERSVPMNERTQLRSLLHALKGVIQDIDHEEL